jgi:hypothetical protein
MDKENVIYIYIHYNRLLFGHKEEWNYIIYKKMDGTEHLHVNKSKSDSERQIPCFLSYVESSPKEKRKVINIKGGLWGKLVGSRKGEDMIKVHCLHIWKCHNKTHLKFAKKDKKGVRRKDKKEQ